MDCLTERPRIAACACQGNRRFAKSTSDEIGRASLRCSSTVNGRRGHQLSRRTTRTFASTVVSQPQDVEGGNRTAKAAQAQIDCLQDRPRELPSTKGSAFETTGHQPIRLVLPTTGASARRSTQKRVLERITVPVLLTGLEKRIVLRENARRRCTSKTPTSCPERRNASANEFGGSRCSEVGEQTGHSTDRASRTIRRVVDQEQPARISEGSGGSPRRRPPSRILSWLDWRRMYLHSGHDEEAQPMEMERIFERGSPILPAEEGCHQFAIRGISRARARAGRS